MLRIRNLGFAYQQESVLNKVSFDSNRGGFTSFVGASGCGKSTLLRLIAGLKAPVTGSITWSSELRGGDSASEMETEGVRGESTAGFVFQKPTLCPWLTAVSNVELPLKLRGVARSERRFRAMDALKLVGLRAQDADKLPSQLSGGMQMRASLARAFIMTPEMMLMDEPFAALDEVLRQQLCETTLRLWQREEWTTLFVTHNVAEAVFLSQRVHLLAGRPSTIVKSFEIPFEVREPGLRMSAEFLAIVSEISSELRAAVEASATDGVQEGAFHG